MRGAVGVARSVLLVVPALVCLGWSCVLDDFRRVEPASPTDLDAGVGSEADAPVACEHAWFPSQPDAAPGGTLSFVVAVRRIDVREQADGGPVGVDLDETCTCQGEGPSCVGAPGADSCDLDEGRDNHFADLMGVLAVGLGTPDVSAFYSGLAEQGHWSLLLRIRHYNGEADDSEVEVAVFVPDGFADVDAGPAWTGFDRWLVAADSLASPDAGDGGFDVEHPRYVDEHGYVRDGVLVAGVPEAELLFGGATSRLRLRMTTVVLSGRIGRTDTGLWSLTDGLLTGILPLDNVFAALGSFRNEQGAPICTDQAGYPVVKGLVCDGADLGSTFVDPKLPCDALSLGIAFEALQAELGEVAVPRDAAPGCEPAADPALDHCP